MANGQDVFGYKRNPKADGVFSTENSTLLVGDGSTAAVAFMVQNWNVEYNQDVQELFEIGSNNLYWAKGRPVGRGSIGRIVGAKGADTENSGLFPKDAYDICNGGATMKINATGGHCDTGSTKYRLNKGLNLAMGGCVVTSIGFAMSVQDVRIMENYGWRFAHLSIS